MTDAEKTTIVEEVLAEMLTRSQQISGLVTATSLDGLTSLPAVRNGDEIVAAPLDLLTGASGDDTDVLADGFAAALTVLEHFKAHYAARANLDGLYAQNADVAFLPSLPLGNATSFIGALADCSTLQIVARQPAASVTDMRWAFSGCPLLRCVTGLDMTAVGTGVSVTAVNPTTGLFYNCPRLTRITLHNLGAVAGTVYDLSGAEHWGEGTETARHTLVASLEARSRDLSASLKGCTVKLHPSVLGRLTASERTTIAARGYTLQSATTTQSRPTITPLTA